MSYQSIIITGTDTNVGKTVFAAMLTLALDGVYWKPLQSGTQNGTDRERVKKLTELPEEHFLPEKYIFTQPLSPHRAAELDNVSIDENELFSLPVVNNHLIIEGAGGLCVPVTRSLLQIDVFKMWNTPVVLCARTSLGTINHTLLSVEALKKRNIPITGIAFIGEENEDSEKTIIDFAHVKRLGRLPVMNEVTKKNLLDAFTKNFNSEDFLID